ncbi:hypothetical protein ACTHQF_01115 [Pedobacter sp. SAFR-022]|uniref:hypothetical protein n=1 Tax=Pedobacter sp. SAFR-022 TaxID=3436861 RepID=UPI003F7FE166
MRVLLVAPINNFKLFDATSFMIGDFMLTNDEDIKNYLRTNVNFIARIGLNQFETILNSHIIYFNNDISELGILKGAEDNTIEEKANVISKYLRMSIDCLWYEKDNSAFIDNVFIELPNKNVIKSHTALFNSDSKGSHDLIGFTKEEMIKGLTLMPLLVSKYQKYSKQNSKIISTVKPIINGRTVNNLNVVPYQHNRVMRAALFLQMVRGNDTVVMKIAFYIAILECLFTSSNSELAHQVSERVALFLKGDKIAKKETYKRIKSAYSVRSSYVHGDNIKLKPEDQVILSRDLDIIVRSSFKMIFKNDYIFLLDKDTKDSTEIFEDFFKDLLFTDDIEFSE